MTETCNLISDYYDKKSISQKEYNDINILFKCKSQNLLYSLWIIAELLTIVEKIISIFFAFRAHIIVKNQIKTLIRAKKALL